MIGKYGQWGKVQKVKGESLGGEEEQVYIAGVVGGVAGRRMGRYISTAG